ncbi:class I SAM-dependent methyltransferase [Streptomonospora wellingtoniae]|uniref:Class I SAM-dependent methyltransferase n=1 Tax=Streptomonospora wellingtoniae TaxID=3075544 RepID=A0ABU2KRG8_9ACTN|nr:class I SAM-dependent methyltransferase [Streptomonospora sp. DSM 45055]MDT0301881.1 class I SAM-dependent methyltransferase [Streptomonospora sp. DSM 45055]
MSVDGGYFDAMYSGSADPWGFATRWYERRKRALTVASLPRERYGRAFEPGCSTGALTRELAARCDALLAWERVAAAAGRAERALAGTAHVRVRRGSVPWEWPEASFDLVVLSELLYYFGDADLRRLLDRAAGSLLPGGDLVAVHWRHPAPDHARSGDDAHRALAAHGGIAPTASHVEADFLLDVYTAGPDPAPSPAQREGLA